MSARVAYVVNPLAPAVGARIEEGVAGLTVSEVVARAGWKLEGTTILVRGGVPVLRKDWDATLVNDNEDVILVVMPLNRQASQIGAVIASLALAVFAPGIGQFLAAELATIGLTVSASLLTATVLVGGQLLISTLVKPPKPFSSTTSPSPTYSLSGAGNRARLGGAIPDAGGMNMIMCDLFTAPYVEYIDNGQVLSAGLMVGVGEYEIHQVRLGQAVIWQDGSPTGAYPEIQIEICGPDDPVTLIDDNVATSSEVSGVTLLGTNEEGYDYAGPFVCSRPGTKVLSLAFDFFFPGGLYHILDDGTLDIADVAIDTEIQEIGNDGTPTGPWVGILSGTFERQTRDPLRVTHRVTVPTPARFWARMHRVNAKSTDKNVSDLIQWVGMRAYLPGVVNYPGLTKIALRATATQNVNTDALSKVNVVCTRKLPMITSIDEGTGIATWSANTATRNPAWYAAYLMRNAELGDMPDNRIPLAQLVSLAETWDGRGDWFDGVFDQRKGLWDGLISTLTVGRARPFMAGSSIAIVRDEPKTVPAAGFSPRNMLPGTFSIDYAFNQVNAVDALRMQFIDVRTWTQNEVLCALDDFAGEPEDAPPFQCFGIVDREHVWREGMYMVAQSRYRRRTPSFKTAMEGKVCFLGSPIKVGHWLASWSKAASVLGLAEDDAGDVLLLSEPWSVPDGKEAEARLVTIAAPDGRIYGPVTFDLVDDGASSSRAQIRLTSTYDLPAGRYAHQQPRDWPVWDGDGEQLERPRCMIGTASEQPQDALLVSMKPDAGGKTAAIVCVIDDPRVHDADTGSPPDEVGGPESTLAADLTITAIALTESTVGGNIIVHTVVSGATDATSFDMHVKRPGDAAFQRPITGKAATDDTDFGLSAGLLTLEMRAKGPAGYGPWFPPITFNLDGTTDVTPADVGTINTNGAALGDFVTGAINNYDWPVQSDAGSYLVQVWARRAGSGSFVLVRSGVEVTTNAYAYYPANEIDDSGPFHNLYIEVKAKNSAGVSAHWVASHV